MLTQRISSTQAILDTARYVRDVARACPDPQWRELQQAEALVRGIEDILTLLHHEEGKLDRFIHDEFGYVRG